MLSNLPDDVVSLCQCGDSHCLCGGGCLKLASVQWEAERLCFGCYLQARVPVVEGVTL